MFGHKHYVPVLRMKPAEMKALLTLDVSLTSRITPLLECPPRVLRFCETNERLKKRAAHFALHLAGWVGREVFLDFSMLPNTLSGFLCVVGNGMQDLGIRPVPVASLKDGTTSALAGSISSFLNMTGGTMCLRVSPEELKLTNVAETIDVCLGHFGVPKHRCHLIIDRGGVDSGTTRYEEFAHLVPNIDEWRTLTLLGGSFPDDLSRLEAGTTNRLRRFEWQHWLALDKWDGRRPAFGDYTIQHVAYKEPVAVPNFSASVRYTIEDVFFVLRGEGVLNDGGPGYGQFNAWASVLMDRPEFFGTGFSAGDSYITERAHNWAITGSAQTWLQAGFSHHLTTAALQVAGRLADVRHITATQTTEKWSSIVHIEAEASL